MDHHSPNCDPFKWSKARSHLVAEWFFAFSHALRVYILNRLLLTVPWGLWGSRLASRTSQAVWGGGGGGGVCPRGLNLRLGLKMVQSLYCRPSTNIDLPAAMWREGMHLTLAALKGDILRPQINHSEKLNIMPSDRGNRPCFRIVSLNSRHLMESNFHITTITEAETFVSVVSF